MVALLGLGIVSAEEAPYRLAGIITSDDGSGLALIEIPGGEQQLLRAGEAIDDGWVADITADTVRLAFPEREVVLHLAGTGNPVSNLPTVYRREDYTGGASRAVDTGKLGAISRLAGSTDTTDSNKLAMKVLTYLGLPAEARIMAVNDQKVESSAEAVQQMAANIDAKGASGFQFVVSIADVSGNKRVYIMADDAGQVTDQTIPAN